MKRLVINCETGEQTIVDIPTDEIEAPQIAVPFEIMRHQARLALLNAGLLDAVETAVAASGAAVKIWYDAPNWKRTDPNIAALGAALGLSSAQIDALFIEAATL